MEEIVKSKEIILDQVSQGKSSINGQPFSKYQKVYMTSNENINQYLNFVSFNNKDNALSVMGSGDQVYNLITNGIFNIDTFDTNKLTEFYVLGLKRAMILKYDYFSYLAIYNHMIKETISLDELSEIINGLLPYMDKKYRDYWGSINDYNYMIQKKYNTNINLFHLLFIHIRDIENIALNNNYLLNEEKYNTLKDRISRANITFNNIDARNLDSYYNKEYDFILLSNILDYFGRLSTNQDDLFKYSDLKEYLDKLRVMLKDNGTIFLNYIFYYKSNNVLKTTLFKNSNITKDDLKYSEVYAVDSPLGRNLKDGIILTKKY